MQLLIYKKFFGSSADSTLTFAEIWDKEIIISTTLSQIPASH